MSAFLSPENKAFLLGQLKPFEPQLVYGFGSRARREGRANSDFDIAFLGKKKIAPVETFNIAQTLASKFGHDVDLIALESASTVLLSQVLKKSILIFAANKRIRQEFEMYALSDYARLNEERKPILERIRKEGRIYG